MLSPDLIARIGEFMSRVNLSAAEIPAYQRCMAALQAEVNRLQAQDPPTT